jgi:hypothetical protein
MKTPHLNQTALYVLVVGNVPGPTLYHPTRRVQVHPEEEAQERALQVVAHAHVVEHA